MRYLICEERTRTYRKTMKICRKLEILILYEREDPHFTGFILEILNKCLKYEPWSFRSGASVAFQVSDTLDYLLVKQDYNEQMRPVNSPGEPVEVVLNLAIRNIGPIDELKEVFSIDCYFRQTWYDNRLQFNTR